jgi:ABC-type Fe3+/spermidine/putrescine transport system ATPase subunit
MLSVKQIVKYYDGERLLDRVSFEVAQQETVCLLGASGSGKSTLLKIISGLEEAEDGVVTWQDENLANVPVHKRNFGLMFQEYALFPHRTIAQNIAFGLEMQKLSKDEINQRVAEALELVELTSFANRSVTELSGGEKQRVALARALAPRPRLLMLDEPLGALDRSLRDQLIYDLRKILRKSGIPAIYVTHDQEEAYTIADRMLLLKDGKVIQSGKPQDVYEHPRNVWVAEFLGLTNRFSGVVNTVNPLIIDSTIGKLQFHEKDIPDLEIGQKVDMVLKPAGLDLLRHANDDRKAKIVDCVFSGEMYRVTLQIGQVQFKVLTRQPYENGQEVAYHLHEDAIICMPSREKE